MKRSLLLIIAIAFCFSDALSNGGPVNGSNIYRLGNIQLVTQPNIQILKEFLYITLRGDTSIIKVNYRLKNENDYAIRKIEYGFPVDYCIGEYLSETDEESNYPVWDSNQLKYFRINIDGKDLLVRFYQDVAVYRDVFKTSKKDSIEVLYKKAWFLTDFSIPKSGEVNLEVEYSVINQFTDFSYTKSFFLEVDKRYLRYDLSPASYWGDSIIREMEIRIDATDIKNNFGEVNLSGLSEFQEENGIYTLQKKNFALRKNQVINITYDNKIHILSDQIMKSLIPKEKIKRIHASSSLPGSYSPENLTDMNFSTAWVEGQKGLGTGEWIEINFKPTLLGAIVLLNGYNKSEKTYTENGHVTQVLLELERKKYDTHTDTTYEVISQKISLDKPEFHSINNRNFWINAQKIADFGDPWLPTRRVKLTILDAKPGTKFDDICISDILICEY